MDKTETELYDKSKRKLDILQRISTNTKIQIEFICQRKMKGLLRLLKERGQYLQELEMLNKTLDSNAVSETANEEMNNLLLQIKAKQLEIVRDNKIALAVAEAERVRIAADLHRVSSEKKLLNSYDYQWLNFTGSQLNQKW